MKKLLYTAKQHKRIIEELEKKIERQQHTIDFLETRERHIVNCYTKNYRRLVNLRDKVYRCQRIANKISPDLNSMAVKELKKVLFEVDDDEQ